MCETKLTQRSPRRTLFHQHASFFWGSLFELIFIWGCWRSHKYTFCSVLAKKKRSRSPTHSKIVCAHYRLPPETSVIKRGFAADARGMGRRGSPRIFLFRDDDYMLRVNKLFREICLARCVCCFSRS